MKSAANPLTAAIYARLNGDATLTALLASPGIFDSGGVPVNQPFDYVVIGPLDSDAEQLRTMARNGEVVEVEIHIWTRRGGMKPGNTILDRIATLLDINLTVAGYALGRALMRSYSQLPDPQEGLQHIVAIFGVWLQET